MSKIDLGNVSIVIPIRNEEEYIVKCLESIVNQDYPKEKLEVILVDGMSEDKTVHIIREYMKKYDFIKLFENPRKTVQYALNIGIQNAAGEYIVRMDAHAEYAQDYVSRSVEYLEKMDAANVGGPTIVKGKKPVQKAIAATYASPFALGGSSHYKDDFEGYADTVAWGAFKRQDLIELGLYDERLPRNEDDDLNFRIIESGGKIFITPKIKSVYYPKDTYAGLFKQYYNYGLWKVAVIKKHKKPARIAHLIPMLFVIFLVGFGLLSIISPFALYTFLGVVFVYLTLNSWFSCTGKHWSVADVMWAHFVIHIAYGSGFCAGIFKFWSTKWEASKEVNIWKKK